LGPQAMDVVDWAATVAVRSGARLKLLHVGHGDGAQVELRHLAERVGVEASCHVQSGPVEEVILREAELHGADLIVIGRGEERQLLGRFRSHAHAIIQRSPCAVLSV
jgi:nucleotide-binding universal stress UspA family protein